MLYGLVGGPYYIELTSESQSSDVITRMLELIVEKGISSSLQVHFLVPQHADLKPLPVIVQETGGELTSEDMLASQRLLLQLWHEMIGNDRFRQGSADGASFARKTTVRVHTGGSFVVPSLFLLRTEACVGNAIVDDEENESREAGDLVAMLHAMIRHGKQGDHGRVMGYESTASASGASPAQLASRYRSIARKIHPDKVRPDLRELAAQSFHVLTFAFGKLASHPACSMHVPEWGKCGLHMITQDPMHVRWRLRRQYLRTKVRSGTAVMAIGAALMNPAQFAIIARTYGARIRAKDSAYCQKQNESGCLRYADLNKYGSESQASNYLSNMWANRANLSGSLDSDVVFWVFFRKYTAMFTDRSLSALVRLAYAGFVVAYLSWTFMLVRETKHRSHEQNWFTNQTAYDTVASVMLYSLRTLFEHDLPNHPALTNDDGSFRRREGSIHAELGFQVLRLLAAPGNTFDSFQAFRVLIRRLIMRRDKGSGAEGNARHGAQQEHAATFAAPPQRERRLSPRQIAAALDSGMQEAKSMLNNVRPYNQVDNLSESDVRSIGILAKVSPKTKQSLKPEDIDPALSRPSSSTQLDDDSDEDEDDSGDEDVDNDDGDASSDDGGDDATRDDGDVRRNPPRAARSAPPVDARAAVAAAREPQLTAEARNELRLKGAVEQLRSQLGNNDNEDGSVDVGDSVDNSSDGEKRAKILSAVIQVLAQLNSHIRKQAAGRENRFNSQHMLCGAEASVNGLLSFAIGDTVAMVCVAREGGRPLHYADFGQIEEITVASSRGTADHARARVVTRTMSGAKFRLRFWRRVPFDAGMISGEPRVLLGRRYATMTDDSDREFLDTSQDAPQIQNRWDVGCLLCRVKVTDIGCAPTCVLSRESHGMVGAILSSLDAGTPLDEAVRSHAAAG